MSGSGLRLLSAEAKEIQEGLESLYDSVNASPMGKEELFELLERAVAGGEAEDTVQSAWRLHL